MVFGEKKKELTNILQKKKKTPSLSPNKFKMWDYLKSFNIEEYQLPRFKITLVSMCSDFWNLNS